jgi:iron complex outermembrane receptor protein
MDLTWSASDAVTLRSISSYQHFDRVSNLVNSGEALKGTAGYNNTRFYALSQEFQILGSVSNLNYVVGAYGGIEKGKEDALNQAGSILLPTPATSARGGNLGDVTNKNIAAFAQVNWKITPELTFTAGGRYTVEQKKVFSHNYTLRNSTGLFFCSLPLAVVDDPANFNVNNVATCNAHFKKSFKDPSWLLSLDYKPIEDVTVYGKVSRGFRSGGLQLRGSTNPDSFTPYDPEYVTEYEIGLKSDLFDRRLRLNLAAYHSDYKGIQRSVVIPLNNQAVSLVTNAAAGRVNGVEVETFLRVSPQFTIGGNASWVDGKYKRFFDVSLGDRTGEDFGVPHFTAGVNSEYTVPTSIGQITFTGNYTFQGNTVLAPDSPFPEAVESGKIGLLNGRVTLAIDQLDAELSVFGTNLTNKFYYSGANSYYRALGFEIGFVGEPRVVGIEFKKHFGR